MSQRKEFPPVINHAINDLTRKYSESPATTNAGRVLRFVAKFVTVDMLLKLITHKTR